MLSDNCCPQKVHVECEREGHATGLLFQSASDKLNKRNQVFQLIIPWVLIDMMHLKQISRITGIAAIFSTPAQ